MEVAVREIAESIEQGNQLPDRNDTILTEWSKKTACIVVLDDDPTGTQTIHNVPVITEWSEAILEKMLLSTQIFFILTNSRSLQKDKADELAFSIGERLRKISKKTKQEVMVISRSDSTLRGHYPNEVEALKRGLDYVDVKEVLVPAFFEGGRYTYNDVHYVKEGDDFVPVAETPFAKDSTFGYTRSNLKEWVVDKTDGRVKKEAIASISTQEIRQEGTAALAAALGTRASHIVINATAPYDLQLAALACLQFKGQLIYRTAASFVNAISGIRPKTLQMNHVLKEGSTEHGGLVIVGSYVPKTSSQLAYLMAHSEQLRFLEFSVADLENEAVFLDHIKSLAKKIDADLQKGEDVVLYTSRKVRTGKTKAESLAIVNKVSSGLVLIVKLITTQPKYMIAKGGITSSDIAVKGLCVKQAIVAGQCMAGVPVWLLDDDSKFPNMPYIIFPGNVGDEDSLHQLMNNLT